MKIKAYAKINLALDVLGVRDDGYHELRMIMVPLDFFDDMDISYSEKMEYVSNRPYIFFDENNTIVKAFNIMKEEFGIKENFKVVLNKMIPTQAGLAGGSTDGAAIIKFLNVKYNLQLSDEKIKELCLKIGADVYFNYYSKPALVEGLGDKLTFIDIKDDYHVLLVKPKRGVSTKECYKKLDMDTCVHPDVDLILDKLKNGENIKPYLKNSLEAPAIELCKGIAKAKRDLEYAGADFTMVTGSGSTVYTIDRDLFKINQLKRKMMNRGYFVRTCQILKSK